MNTTTTRIGTGIAATLMGLGALWYVVMGAVSATGFPGYSYSHNFISDLGVPDKGVFQGRAIDSVLANVMNAGFLGQALMVALAGIVLWWALPGDRKRNGILALALIHSFGISLVGLVNGSPRNVDAGLAIFHFGGAVLAILGGNALISLAGSRTIRGVFTPWFGRASTALTSIGVASVLILIGTSISGRLLLFDYGVWERISVYTFLAWQLMFAVVAMAKLRPHLDAGTLAEED